MNNNFTPSQSSKDNLAIYREETCLALSQLANKLHQVQLLLEKNQADEAKTLIKQAVSECETIILLI